VVNVAKQNRRQGKAGVSQQIRDAGRACDATPVVGVTVHIYVLDTIVTHRVDIPIQVRPAVIKKHVVNTPK